MDIGEYRRSVRVTRPARAPEIVPHHTEPAPESEPVAVPVEQPERVPVPV